VALQKEIEILRNKILCSEEAQAHQRDVDSIREHHKRELEAAKKTQWVSRSINHALKNR